MKSDGKVKVAAPEVSKRKYYRIRVGNYMHCADLIRFSPILKVQLAKR